MSMRRYLRFLPGFLMAAGLLAQAPFTMRSTQGANVQALSDGGTITFASEGIGQSLSATVVATYTNRTGVTIHGIDVLGSTDFSATLSGTPPLTLILNDTFSFGIQYTPTALGKVTGTIRISYTEGSRTTNLTINVVGVQPDFGFSFQLPKSNQTAILPDGTIAFPETTVNTTNPSLSQTTAATFVVTNRGSGQGSVNNVVATGAAFNVTGVALLPAVLQPNGEIKFNVNFAPTQLAASRGSVRIEFVGRTVSFNLTGSGVGAVIAYEATVGATSQALAANDTLNLPAAKIGEKSTATVRVRNTGSADGTITRITASGGEFTLSDLPPVPLTLQKGGSISFKITFAPTQPGEVRGSFRIDDVSFNLSGVGQGVTLTYSATIGTATATIPNNATLVFPPTQVGAPAPATIQFQVSNTGNIETFIIGITVSGPAGSVFSLANLPALPARLGAGENVAFSVVFTPSALGPAAGTLRVDNQTFNLSGLGTDPPPLPGVSISFPGAGGAVDAAQQLSARVTLAEGYPVNLIGRLILTFTPASEVFGDDPSIQFASGGRSLPFVVPALQRDALFGLNADRIAFQTGTVAGTITLTALFSTDPGGINLTTTTAPATNVTVRSSAPRIRSVQIGARTASGFTVLVTGYSPTRAVTQMAFQFTAFTDPNNKDLKLDTTSLNLSVDGPFSAWYQSTASQPFGSLFTATVNFNVRGDIDAIQSLAVTVSNSLGTSNSASASLR